MTRTQESLFEAIDHSAIPFQHLVAEMRQVLHRYSGSLFAADPWLSFNHMELFRYGMIWMCNFPWMDENSSEICSLHNEPASFGDLHGLTLFCAGNQGSQAEPIAASFLPTRRGWVQPSQ